jgi:hypothetical protein
MQYREWIDEFWLPYQQILRKLVILVIMVSCQKVWGLMMAWSGSSDAQLNNQWPYKRCYNFEPFTIGNNTRQIVPATRTICLDHFSWCYTSTSPIWKPSGQIHHICLMYPPLGWTPWADTQDKMMYLPSEHSKQGRYT